MTLKELKNTIRSGPYAWPGGYPIYFVTHTGDALAFETVKANLKAVMRAIQQGRGGDSDWRVTGCEINWEDGDLTDAHTGKRIESAYAEVEDNADNGAQSVSIHEACGDW